MNARTQDVNLLKIALLPASILATVVLALSVMATTISNAVTVDSMITAQTASQTATLVARTPTGLRAGSGG